MLKLRWTYSLPSSVSEWDGSERVSYYGKYVIGIWFSLNAETGEEYWSRRMFRPGSICDCADGVIVASDFKYGNSEGVYGIDANTGEILWKNHADGFWGKVCQWLEYVPLLTNEFRDSPDCVVDGKVFTCKGRTLDIRTGEPTTSKYKEGDVLREPKDLSPAGMLKRYGKVELDDCSIKVEGHAYDFVLSGKGNARWQFVAREHGCCVENEYHIHGNHIFVILGDGPDYVPVGPSEPHMARPNEVRYLMGIIDARSGDLRIHRLQNGEERSLCRIEAVRDNRMLISYGRNILEEYEITV